MEVLLPDGARGVYGGLGSGVEAHIEVRDENFFKRCVLHGPIGFAEAYMAGEWTTPDLVKVIAWFILNSDEAEALLGSLLTTTPPSLVVTVAEAALADIRAARLN